MRLAYFILNIFGQFVLNPATLNFWNLIVWMRAFNLIGPLHFLSCYHQTTWLRFTVLSWSEWNNKVGAFFAVRFKLSILRVYSEFISRVGRELSCEISEILQMVRQSKADARGLVQWRLNQNSVIDFGIEGLEDDIELPSATARFINDELNIRFERFEGLKS